MADLHIVREHALGQPQAQQVAARWAQQMRETYGADCVLEVVDGVHTLRFTGPGFQGSLQVAPDRFTLQARLGFLLSAYQSRIEAHIAGQLDALLGPALAA